MLISFLAAVVVLILFGLFVALGFFLYWLVDCGRPILALIIGIIIFFGFTWACLYYDMQIKLPQQIEQQ